VKKSIGAGIGSGSSLHGNATVENVTIEGRTFNSAFPAALASDLALRSQTDRQLTGINKNITQTREMHNSLGNASTHHITKINKIIAGTPDELEIFEEMDQERDAQFQMEWEMPAIILGWLPTRSFPRRT
jgi:hypothetical protein